MTGFAQPIDLQRPPRIQFGVGSLAQLKPYLDDSGLRRPYVVADAVNAARLDALGLGQVPCFGQVEPEPGIPNLRAAALAAGDADVIIGFGGGSAMDLAKLVAVLAGTNLTFEEISGPHRIPGRRVALIQIPTTAGTGSEVGTRALVTDPDSHAKVATESVHMLADLAIIDPELTMSVPPHVTAATGVDAMAHCVEAFTSRRAHPLIDAYAIQGIKLVGRYLKRAVEDGTDAEARAGLAYAAFCGGVCLGPVNTTAGHATAYPLGTRHGLPHGIANALMFPHVLAANAAARPEKTAQICAALGFSGASRDSVVTGALTFCAGLGLDMCLSSHGVLEADLEVMAEEAHAIRRLLDWNPVDLSQSAILDLYRAAL